MIIIDEQTKKLLEEMGFFPSAKDKMLYEIEIENGKAYVDFRKVDGRRFTMINGKPVDDEDSITILKQFKEERKKITDALLQNIGADSQSRNIEESAKTDKINSPDIPDNSKGGEKSILETPTHSTQGSKAPPAHTLNEAQQGITPIPASQSQKKICKFSDGECCQKVDVLCKGEVQDKAECPLWSGRLYRELT